MERVELINLDGEATNLLLTSPEGFEERFQLKLGGHAALAADVARQALEHVAPRSADPRWWGYLALHPENHLVVGTCGFKSAPSDDGLVEIAYFTFPGLEGQGIATAMARGLVRIAFASPRVSGVVAHTLPAVNASTRVLSKLSFRFVGPHPDPEDGTVWRWLLTRSASEDAG